MSTQDEFSRNTGQVHSDGAMCELSPPNRSASGKSISFAGETRAPHTAMQDGGSPPSIPTCPDTSLPWSGDCAHGGWSARMFLHQLYEISAPHWKLSDTERLLSRWTLRILRVNNDAAGSLSDYLDRPGRSLPNDSVPVKSVAGIVRRALKWHRKLRVLLRTEHATTPTILTFGTDGPFVDFRAVKENDLVDSLLAGLLAHLTQCVHKCVATQLCQQSPSGLENGSTFGTHRPKP